MPDLTNQEIAELRNKEWMPSRIPATAALACFVPESEAIDADLNAKISAYHRSRWFPVDGGYRVIVPYDGETFDESFFRLEEEAWDHEHCFVCNDHIPSMTLCWVTRRDPYILLCDRCFRKHAKRKPWWKA